jgi:hypothetical protein
MQNYYLHHEKHEEHEEIFKFSAQAENKKTYFSDFPCVALRNARAHFIVRG